MTDVGKTQVFTDYNPVSEIRISATDPITNIPYMTRRASEILFANAYIRTIADLAELPKQFPGLASAFAQDSDFKTWAMILEFAQKVVDSPQGLSVKRSAFVSSSSSVPQTSSTTSESSTSDAGGCHIM